MKAVIYSRFSTDRQTDSSIADQTRVCGEHAERQGWQVVERFEDQGISGAALGNRPGVLKLREAALARRFDVLVVMDLSRLSRSNGDLAKLIDRFTFAGIRIVGVQDGFDTARDGHELVSGLSGIMGQQFRKMVAKKTHTALESRAKTQRPTGGRAYGFDCGAKVDKGEALIVQEIFGRYADGASCNSIASELNARRIPSPGSTWNRSERRCSGWLDSSVRVIVRNERYTGRIHWNCSEWRKDPDTGLRKRIARPRSEWICYNDESQRIISDELWQRAQQRSRPVSEDPKLKAGGRPKYLLSGLLRCNTCGAHFTITNATSYGCSTNHGGNACPNNIQVRRDRAEEVLLRGRDTGLAALLEPERVERMGKEMQDYYAERISALQTRATEVPQELQELGARIERLRERLRKGDPDMAADEIQAAIDRAEAKRQELESQQPAAKASAKVLSILPKAAELYRRQIAEGLGGNEREALKARVFLREWFSGQIRLEPLPDGGLMAHWNQNAVALLRGVGTFGSGGRI